jgi:hypothetical protein
MEKKGEEFPRLQRTVIIIKPTIYEQIEEDKRIAIRTIMSIVDTQIQNEEVHGFIRKSVLDAINDMARSFATTLDRVVDKLEGSNYPQAPGSLNGPREKKRIKELNQSKDVE